ncbi:hypothetical protein [Paenibacillus taichungensis]|uniref:hypothetical protein n=1 Tax=Paenibacillus taichungensis TaxID=484184 RepID=UPI002870EF56|nr:hypothetical protein [Paenibacillus taichungensis]MDR9744357.1 hypothetical protein [Paenibacillus taichungensis]
MKKMLFTLMFAFLIFVVFISSGVLLSFLFFNMNHFENLFLLLLIFLISFSMYLYLGLEFYSLRKHVPIIYGALEIVIAIFTIIIFIVGHNSQYNVSGFFIIYTTLYIVVRGMDNINKHYEQNKHDLLKKILDKELVFAKLFNKFIKVLDVQKNIKSQKRIEDNN